VLLWGGGIWSWLDAKTVIRAMERVAAKRSDIKLVFLSTQSAEPDLIEMPSVKEAIDLAEDLGLSGRSVIFNTDGYVDYEIRSDYFLEADIGVCAHHKSLETHYAFRTRTLDYLHCGLPIITSSGDYFGRLVARENLGRAIEPEDHVAWADAILALAEDPDELARCRENVLATREQFAWSRVTEPLLEFCLRGKDRGLPAHLAEVASVAATFAPLVSTPITTIPQGPPPAAIQALDDVPTSEIHAQILNHIKGLRTQLAQLDAHTNSLEARHQHALDVLRVLQVQIGLIKKIPFSQSIWRLIRRIRYSHLRG